MESLGLEPIAVEDEVESPVDTPTAANLPNAPVVSVPTGRLSDSFAAPSEAVRCIEDESFATEPKRRFGGRVDSGRCRATFLIRFPL